VAAGLAGLVWRMYDVILFCFDYRNIGLWISPLFSHSMTHYFSPKLYACWRLTAAITLIESDVIYMLS